MTATPRSGFVFANWTGGAALPLNVLTNSPTIQFTMQSNLTLQATFVETSKPAITFITPTLGQNMTNALATLTGTASDNWQITNVWYRLNSGPWMQGITTNGYTNWNSALLKLSAGTNWLSAYAANLGGLLSATNTVNFVSSNDFKLQISFPTPKTTSTTGVDYTVQLSPGLSGHIQVSTDLVSWVTLTNFIGTNTTLSLRDQSATNPFTRRFYRAVIP